MTDTLTGVVSWFSAAKGFGFIKPVDGSEDVFLHASVLQKAGVADLRDGTTVTCEVMPGRKGRQAARLLEIDDSTAISGGTGEASPRIRAPRVAEPGPGGGYGGAEADGVTGSGVVKWFNATKGFGFITPDSGGKDVFLHASVLRRAGLADVAPGQRVQFTSVDRDKGPEARTLVIDDSR